MKTTTNLRSSLPLLLICCAINSFAADITINGILYDCKKTDKTAEVVRRTANGGYSGDIVIPQNITYDNQPYTVARIGEKAFYNCTNLTSISLPSSIVEIKKEAFRYCSGLSSIILPNSVETIGDYAFSRCQKIVSISFGNSVRKIGNGAFAGCNKIQSIELPSSLVSLGNEVFSGCNGVQNKTLVIPASLESLGSHAFDSWIELNHVAIMSENVSMGSQIFNGCNNLQTIALNCKVIGHEAFKGLSSLDEIDFGNNLETIDMYAFQDCISLKEINLPKSVTTIRNMAFMGCTSLSSLLLGDDVMEIGNGAFAGCSNISAISVSSNNPYYDSRNNCNAIIETATNTMILACFNSTIPSSVVILGPSVFEGQTSITEIELPNTLEVISHQAFFGCSGLKQINLPGSVKYIGNRAFYGCTSLDSVYISHVDTIEFKAFENCTNLRAIHIPNTVKRIASYAFTGCSNLKAVYIDDLNAWLNIEFWCNDKEEPSLTANPLYYARKLYLNNKLITHLELPCSPSSYSLVHGVFSSVTFSDELQNEPFLSIGTQAFRGAVMTSLTLPPNLGYIGTYAFLDCNYSPKFLVSLRPQPINCGSELIYWNGYDDGIRQLIVPEDGLDLYKNESSWNMQRYTSFSEYPVGINYRIMKSGATYVKSNVTYYPITKEYDYGNKMGSNEVIMVFGLDPGKTGKNSLFWMAEDGNHVSTTMNYTTQQLVLETQAAEAVSNRQARISATTNGADDSLRFGFEWRKYDAPDMVPSTFSPCPVYDGVLAGTLNNLTPNSYYKYRAYYKTDSGNTYYGEWMAFGTIDTEAYFEPVVHTTECTNIKSSSAMVSGYAVPGSEETEEQGFEYWPEDGDGNKMPRKAGSGHDVQTVLADGMVMSAQLTGLQSGTVYHYRAYVKTSKATTYGEERSFKTLGSSIPNSIVSPNDTEVYIIGYYDALGRKHEGLHHGLNIIRYSDGTVRKVRVK